MSDTLKKERAKVGERYVLMDLWRSLAVCLMVVFHALYDLQLFGVLPAGTMEQPWAMTARFVGGANFVFISGAVVRFSRDPVRRGFKVFCAGLLVAVVTAVIRMPVVFGILQLLGVCMILFGLLRSRIEQWQGLAFALICMALFAASWWLTDAVQVDIKFLYPFGLRSEKFYSADYYPIFPWMFLFLCGTSFGKYLAEHRKQNGAERKIPAFLTAPGRFSLPVYLLHQPILYGVIKVIFG